MLLITLLTKRMTPYLICFPIWLKRRGATVLSASHLQVLGRVITQLMLLCKTAITGKLKSDLCFKKSEIQRSTMILIEFLKGVALALILFLCFAFLLLLIRVFRKKRKRRKKQSRRRMEGGSPKLLPRYMPIAGQGQSVDLEMQNYCDGDQNAGSNSESTSVLIPEALDSCKTNQANMHNKTGRTIKHEIVNEKTTRKKVKYAWIYGKRRKGSESNHPGARCTEELQNSEPIIKKKGSTVPLKSSDNSGGDQNGRSNSSGTCNQPGACRGQFQNSESMIKKRITTRSTVPTTSRSKSGKVT